MLMHTKYGGNKMSVDISCRRKLNSIELTVNKMPLDNILMTKLLDFIEIVKEKEEVVVISIAEAQQKKNFPRKIVVSGFD